MINVLETLIIGKNIRVAIGGMRLQKIWTSKLAKVFENTSITGTSRSQNGSIKVTKICLKGPFSRNFHGNFGAATDLSLKSLLHIINNYK